MNTWKIYGCIFALSFLMICGCSEQDKKPTINVIYPSFHVKLMSKIAKDFEDKTGYNVNVHYVNYDEQYGEILKSLNSAEPLYDVFSLDLIWTTEFAKKGYCVDITDKVSPLASDIAPAILDAFKYNEGIFGMPFMLDFQIFFYNSEYIKNAGFSSPPKTLEDMVAQMRAMKKKGIVEYPWHDSWKQNEALICEYVWLTAAFGGETFDENGKPIFNNGPGLRALEFMKKLLDEGLVNPISKDSDEEMVTSTFVNGFSAFDSNWTVQYATMKDIAKSKVVGQAEMGLLPVSKMVLGKYKNDTVSVSGFEGFGILSNSAAKDAAWEFIEYITSPEVQHMDVSMMPLWNSVQKSPLVITKDPTISIKSKQLASVHHRPRVDKYAEISAIMQRYIHRALRGELEPKAALDKATKEINSIIDDD